MKCSGQTDACCTLSPHVPAAVMVALVLRVTDPTAALTRPCACQADIRQVNTPSKQDGGPWPGHPTCSSVSSPSGAFGRGGAVRSWHRVPSSRATSFMLLQQQTSTICAVTSHVRPALSSSSPPFSSWPAKRQLCGWPAPSRTSLPRNLCQFSVTHAGPAQSKALGAASNTAPTPTQARPF